MECRNYCMYTFDDEHYTTSCGKIIPRDNYVDKYCTHCGKRIVVPIVIWSDTDTEQLWHFHYA